MAWTPAKVRARIPTVLALAAALLVVAPGTSHACQGVNKTPLELGDVEARRAVICLVNERRRKHDARRLRERADLDSAASGHSTAMVSSAFFSHFSPNGASPVTRIEAAGYLDGARSWSVGENLRFGYGEKGTPRAAVAAFMSSSSHRRTMLDRRWKHIGVGFKLGTPADQTNPDGATYTVDFGRRRG